jgi:hypothetical protein
MVSMAAARSARARPSSACSAPVGGSFETGAGGGIGCFDRRQRRQAARRDEDSFGPETCASCLRERRVPERDTDHDEPDGDDPRNRADRGAEELHKGVATARPAITVDLARHVVDAGDLERQVVAHVRDTDRRRLMRAVRRAARLHRDAEHLDLPVMVEHERPGARVLDRAVVVDEERVATRARLRARRGRRHDLVVVLVERRALSLTAAGQIDRAGWRGAQREACDHDRDEAQPTLHADPPRSWRR